METLTYDQRVALEESANARDRYWAASELALVAEVWGALGDRERGKVFGLLGELYRDEQLASDQLVAANVAAIREQESRWHLTVAHDDDGS